jgi:tRNA pseudouridine65 synthase
MTDPDFASRASPFDPDRKGALEVLYADEALVVVNKPSGLLVHRGLGRDRVVAMTLVRNMLHQHVYPVHRLDRGTSGALAFTRDKATAAQLQRDFAEGRVQKVYLALVRGVPAEAGVIDHPVPSDESKARVPAVTEFRRLFTFERYSLVEARPLTGRFHQIRRHLKHAGHPIVGDVNYGRGEINREFRARFGLFRIALHALSLRMPHPVTRADLKVVAPLPADLAMPLQAMGIPGDYWRVVAATTPGAGATAGPPTPK